MIFADFNEICSDFLRFSRKTLELLEISRFQFNVIMIIPEIHLIFDLIFDLILFNFTFNFHIGTTPPPASAGLWGSAAARGGGGPGQRPARLPRGATGFATVDGAKSTRSAGRTYESPRMTKVIKGMSLRHIAQ